jgi:hypothetical protein
LACELCRFNCRPYIWAMWGQVSPSWIVVKVHQATSVLLRLWWSRETVLVKTNQSNSKNQNWTLHTQSIPFKLRWNVWENTPATLQQSRWWLVSYCCVWLRSPKLVEEREPESCVAVDNGTTTAAAHNYIQGWDYHRIRSLSFTNMSHRTLTKCYLDQETEGQDVDVLDYWRGWKRTFPILSWMHLCFLAIPATSAPWEPVFSHGWAIVSWQPSALQPDKIKQALWAWCRFLGSPLPPPEFNTAQIFFCFLLSSLQENLLQLPPVDMQANPILPPLLLPS